MSTRYSLRATPKYALRSRVFGVIALADIALYRKAERPGFVETPRPRRSRKSVVPEDDAEDSSSATDTAPTRSLGSLPVSRSTSMNGQEATNGSVNGHSESEIKMQREPAEVMTPTTIAKPDPKIDTSGEFDFGGPFGVTAMMIGFPILMWYMWIGATYYDGKFPTRVAGETFMAFASRMGGLVYEGAYPSLRAWQIYWTFFIFEGACYCLLPGIWAYGKPLPHENGKQLPYWCSGIASFYTTIVVMGSLHASGIFPLYTFIDEFGPLLSVAICSGYIVSVIAYISAFARGATHRMTGIHIYDFFMGAELNPRMFKILDFKMFFEVRLPWYILFGLSVGAACRQYEQYGYVSGEVMFLVMAHFLYANACSKAEECIVTTWYVSSNRS